MKSLAERGNIKPDTWRSPVMMPNVILLNIRKKAKKITAKNPKKEAAGILMTATTRTTHLKEVNGIERRKRSTRRRAKGIEVMSVERSLPLVSSPLTVTVIIFWTRAIVPTSTLPPVKPVLIQRRPHLWAPDIQLCH